MDADLLRGAGEEDLFGVGGDDAVKGELADAVAAKFEEEAGAIAGFCVDDIDELHFGSAVEVSGVGDALDGGLDVAKAVVLSDDGDVAEGGSGASGVGGVDVGGGSAVAEGVGLEVFIEKRLRRWVGVPFCSREHRLRGVFSRGLWAVVSREASRRLRVGRGPSPATLSGSLDAALRRPRQG